MPVNTSVASEGALFRGRALREGFFDVQELDDEAAALLWLQCVRILQLHVSFTPVCFSILRIRPMPNSRPLWTGTGTDLPAFCRMW